VGKYGEARHVSGDSLIQRMCFTCLITKTTHTLIICNNFFRDKNGFTNASQYYVIRTLHVLLFSLHKYGYLYVGEFRLQSSKTNSDMLMRT
jgi:hypothetical protein